MSRASPWARDTALALRAHGHGVHVVDFATAPSVPSYLSADDADQQSGIAKLRDNGVSIHLLHTTWRSGLRYIIAAPQLRRVVHDVRGDVVLALYGGGLAMLAWVSGVRPYAVYVVGSDVLMAQGRLRGLSSRFLEQAGAVFSNGEYLAEQTRLFAPRARVLPLYLGIAVDDFPIVPQRVAVPRVICTRGFLPVYNNKYLIEGLAARARGAAPVPTTFVSKGPDLDYVRAYADRILSVEQRSAVAFLGGVDRARLLAELAISQVYVSLSISDGTSTSLLEGFASGLFPILSDIPQNREWIDSSAANGILVPLHDSAALALALERALRDEELRVRAAIFNQRLVRERADAYRNMGVVVDRLQAMIPSPSGSPA